LANHANIVAQDDKFPIYYRFERKTDFHFHKIRISIVVIVPARDTPAQP
jgi:hypothetical protein